MTQGGLVGLSLEPKLWYFPKMKSWREKRNQNLNLLRWLRLSWDGYVGLFLFVRLVLHQVCSVGSPFIGCLLSVWSSALSGKGCRWLIAFLGSRGEWILSLVGFRNDSSVKLEKKKGHDCIGLVWKCWYVVHAGYGGSWNSMPVSVHWGVGTFRWAYYDHVIKLEEHG